MIDPNSQDFDAKDAHANPDADNHGTENEKTLNPALESEQGVDYKEKFSHSSREAQRLLDEKKALQAERDEAIRAKEELLAKYENTDTDDHLTEELYPGFQDLDEEQKESINRLSQGIAKQTRDSLYKDPAIAFMKKTFNEKKFDDALQNVINKYPELKDSQGEFKQKYFKSTDIPNNIEDILTDLVKVHLFDKAKDIGAEEERQRQNRMDTERATAGEKTDIAPTRTLEEWQELQQRDPAKFAKLSKEFNELMKSGKL